jgi:hypothetical protein
LKARPVQGSRAPFVFGIQIHIFLFKIVKTDRLVSLGSNVQNIQSILVLYINIRFIFDQTFNNFNISSEWCIMQSCKFIFSCLFINPLIHFLFWEFLFCPLYDKIKHLGFVFESSHVNQCEAITVQNFIYFDSNWQIVCWDYSDFNVLKVVLSLRFLKYLIEILVQFTCVFFN